MHRTINQDARFSTSMGQEPHITVTHPERDPLIEAARAYIDPFLRTVMPADHVKAAAYTWTSVHDPEDQGLVDVLGSSLMGDHLFVNLPEGTPAETYAAARRATPKLFEYANTAYEIVIEPEEQLLARFRPN